MPKKITGFHDRVADEAGQSAKAVDQMADRFYEMGDLAMANLAKLVAQRLKVLVYDSLVDTQPVDIEPVS